MKEGKLYLSNIKLENIALIQFELDSKDFCLTDISDYLQKVRGGV